jgi:hypothetical protein
LRLRRQRCPISSGSRGRSIAWCARLQAGSRIGTTPHAPDECPLRGQPKRPHGGANAGQAFWGARAFQRAVGRGRRDSPRSRRAALPPAPTRIDPRQRVLDPLAYRSNRGK